MAAHKRSELNKALDQCPDIVQQAVWGKDGYREQIETLREVLEYAENKLYILLNTKNALRPIVRTDAKKAYDRIQSALEMKGIE